MAAAISSGDATFRERGRFGGSGSFGIGVDCLTTGVAASAGAASGAALDPAAGGAEEAASCASTTCIGNAVSAAAKIADLSRTFIIFVPAPRDIDSRADDRVPSRPYQQRPDGPPGGIPPSAPINRVSSALMGAYISIHSGIQFWSTTPCRPCSSDKPISTSRS